MNNINIKEALSNSDKYLNKKIKLQGWVRNIRSSNAFAYRNQLTKASLIKKIELAIAA